MTALRTYLLLEVMLFAAASLLHRGLLVRGFEHFQAAVAESVIGLALSVGLAVAVYRPGAARTAALWAQGVALSGVVIGLVTIIIGVGPRTPLEYGLHGLMVLVLLMGLAAAQRVMGD
jgi:hypothetical protein